MGNLGTEHAAQPAASVGSLCVDAQYLKEHLMDRRAFRQSSRGFEASANPRGGLERGARQAEARV